MWSGSGRLGRRAAALALGVLLWAAPAALAAPGIELRLPGGSGETFLTAAQISDAADVPVTEYIVRSPEGREESVFNTGTRLATVLFLAGIDPASVSFLELERPDGTTLAIPREAIDPPAGPPPLVWIDGTTVGFIRPSAGPGDSNSRDSFSFDAGEALRVTARTGTRLTVTARAGRRRIEAGEAVTFAGEAAGAPAGERLGYEWRFGDGTTATGRRVTHEFRRPGRYEVILRATGDGDSGGTSEPVTILVGEPARPRPGRGRGESADPNAPDSGPNEGGGGGGAEGVPQAPPAVGGEAAPPAVGAEPEPEPEPEPRRERAGGPERDRGPRVSGVRIETVGRPVTPSRAGAAAPRAAAVGGVAPEDPRSAAPVAGLLVVAALLALGIWRESKEG
jgi:hypothetical protein